MDDTTRAIHRLLEEAVLKKKQKEALDTFKQTADRTVAELAASISPEDISKALGERITEAVGPALEKLLHKEKASTQDIISAIKNIQLEVPEITLTTPVDQRAPVVNVPAPIVNIPAPIVNVPPVVFPESLPYPTEFSIRGLNPKNPLPVQMVDMAGKPYFPGGSGGATGGKGDFFTIVGIQNTILSVNADPAGVAYSSANPLPVTITSGGSATSASNIVDSTGVAYTGSNPLPVTFTGSSSTSVSLVNADGTYYNSANPFPTTATLSAVTGQGDGASALRIIQAGDTVSSVVVNSGTLTAVTTITNSVSAALVDSTGVAYSGSNPLPTTGSATLSAAVGQGDSASALRTIQAGDSVSSVIVNSGTLTAVTSITSSVASALVDAGGVAYSGSNPVPVTITSGATATSASALVDSTGIQYSGSNPLPITGTVTVGSVTASIAAALVDSSGIQYSGSNPLIVDSNDALGQGDSTSAIRTIQAGDSVSSVVVNSGTLTAVTSITNSVASALVDSSGVAYSGSNPLPTTGSATLSAAIGQGDGASALRTIQAGDTVSSVIVNSGTITAVTSITNSVAAALVDSSGVAYSGSNPLPTTATATLSAATNQGDTASALRVVHAGDSAASVMSQATGLNETTVGVLRTVTMSDTASSSQTKLRAMTTLPTAVADAADTFQRADKLGRALSRPINVRDLIATARAQVTTSAETTLATASAGQFLDLISVLFANQSTSAISVDIRALVGGNIEQTIEVPATATAGWTPPVPWPMSNSGNAWTFQLSTTDQSNTTLTGTALFSKES